MHSLGKIYPSGLSSGLHGYALFPLCQRPEASAGHQELLRLPGRHGSSHGTGDTVLRNIQFSVFTILGVAGFLLSRRFLSGRGKIVLAAEAILLAFFVYTGSNFPYYGYIFSIFPVLGFVALGSGIGSLLEKLPRKDLLPQTMGGHFPKMLPEALLAIICLVFAYYKSPNTADIGKSPDSLVQYQFAAIINESEPVSTPPLMCSLWKNISRCRTFPTNPSRK